jgi:hypothetical protein
MPHGGDGMIPPTCEEAAAAIRDAIVYHEDPLASTIATRLLILEARYLGETSMRRAYGQEWESLLGLMRIAETITADEEQIMSDELELRHRRLLRIGLDWLTELGREEIASDVVTDVCKVAGPDLAERSMTALKLAAVAGMLHRDTAADTPITVADEHDMTNPIREVLKARGVNL